MDCVAVSRMNLYRTVKRIGKKLVGGKAKKMKLDQFVVQEERKTVQLTSFRTTKTPVKSTQKSDDVRQEVATPRYTVERRRAAKPRKNNFLAKITTRKDLRDVEEDEVAPVCRSLKRPSPDVAGEECCQRDAKKKCLEVSQPELNNNVARYNQLYSSTSHLMLMSTPRLGVSKEVVPQSCCSDVGHDTSATTTCVTSVLVADSSFHETAQRPRHEFKRTVTRRIHDLFDRKDRHDVSVRSDDVLENPNVGDETDDDSIFDVTRWADFPSFQELPTMGTNDEPDFMEFKPIVQTKTSKKNFSASPFLLPVSSPEQLPEYMRKTKWEVILGNCV